MRALKERQTIGKWLKSYRLLRGLTLRGAASLGGLAFTSIDRAERGAMPSVRTLGRIAEGYGLSDAEIAKLVRMAKTEGSDNG